MVGICHGGNVLGNHVDDVDVVDFVDVVDVVDSKSDVDVILH